MRLALRSAFFLISLSGCLVDHVERRAPAASKRERDSIIGASRIPGAQGVGGALRVSDSAGSRRAQEDSTVAGP
jgi:hypothetical protein